MIDSRLNDCGSRPEVEENFNRILVMIDAATGAIDAATGAIESLDSRVDAAEIAIADLLDRVHALEPNADLASIVFEAAVLDPVFGAHVFEYTAETAADHETLTVAAVDSANAMIVIMLGEVEQTNGADVAFAVGENTITVTVTNGSVEHVYTIVVTRTAA